MTKKLNKMEKKGSNVAYSIDMDARRSVLEGLKISGEFKIDNKKPRLIYYRVIKFNGMDFHFAVNEEKKKVHGWLDWFTNIHSGRINDDGRAEVIVDSFMLTKGRIEATVHCDDTDYFYPLFGISVCLLKLIHKIEQHGHKKKQSWKEYKDWINNEKKSISSSVSQNSGP